MGAASHGKEANGGKKRDKRKGSAVSGAVGKRRGNVAWKREWCKSRCRVCALTFGAALSFSLCQAS